MPDLTKSQKLALRVVLNMAIENSCTCGNSEYVDGKGYQGHDTDCTVNKERKPLMAMWRLAYPNLTSKL